MSNDRIDRFVWQEGEVELYDKDGNMDVEYIDADEF